MSSIYFVFGGRVTDPQTFDFEDISKIEAVGFYSDMASAKKAWQSAAQRSVDDAETRYVVVDLQKLLQPGSN